MLGKVECYSTDKKWGFIMGDDGRRYYVSSGNIKTRSGALFPGYQVTFNAGEGNKAYNVDYL